MLNLGRSIQLNTIHSAAKTSRNLLLPFLNAKNFYYTEDCVRRDLADNVAHDTHNIYKTLRPQQGKTWRGLAPITQAHKITHPEKDICEDAYFINGNTFGIADGVGVWSQVGGNSALYSKSLMEHIEEALCEKEGCSLYEALVHGYTKNFASKTAGSSTVCLAKLDGNELHTLNLGDSVFAIFRNNKLIYKSEEQVHSFNYPYQLGTGGDSPTAAKCIKCDLKQGDLIILGTDGLFDNLFIDEMEDIISHSEPDKIAINLSVSAMAAACSTKKTTPFSEKIAEETDHIWNGGKLDDITVVARYVI